MNRPTSNKMRTDVAEVLGLDPDAVGDDTDLFELGLDSVRLMSLVSRVVSF